MIISMYRLSQFSFPERINTVQKLGPILFIRSVARFKLCTTIRGRDNFLLINGEQFCALYHQLETHSPIFKRKLNCRDTSVHARN
jgi:hypothetical protein